MSEIFTVVDIETTGLNHEADNIIEIAAIRTDGFREYGRFHALIRPPEGIEIPPVITELCGIKMEDVIGGLREDDAIDLLETFSKGTTVVAHHVPFDFGFLYRPFIFKLRVKEFICTRALAKLVEPDESPSLKEVCARHSIELNGHHRAMNDVEATAQVLFKLREIADARGIDYRNVVIDSKERPLTFIPQGATVKKI